MDYSNLFVVLMGLGTVFAGLLCIILLVSLMSWVCTRTAGAQTPPKAAVPAGCGGRKPRHDRGCGCCHRRGPGDRRFRHPYRIHEESVRRNAP